MAAPKGNQNARKAKDWEVALRRALANYETAEVKRGQALETAARRVVKAAVEGDFDAIEHIANRLDGKPTEYHETTHRHAASELSDGELERIATGGSAGAAESQASAPNSSGIH